MPALLSGVPKFKSARAFNRGFPSTQNVASNNATTKFTVDDIFAVHRSFGQFEAPERVCTND